MARSNAEIKVRFQRISEWVRPPYVCGWPNFEQADYPDGTFYGHYLLADVVADWQDVRFVDLQSPAENPLRGWFTHAHDFAVSQGYQHGFPNFQQANYNDGRGNVYGVHLIVAGTAQVLDVPARDLGLGNADPETHTMDEWFWGAGRWATSNGFVAGMPTGHRSDYGNGFVCGVLLFPAGTAHWVDVVGTDLSLPSTPPPYHPSGTLVVTVTLDASSGALRVWTTNPESWEGRDARIMGVSSRYDQDIYLSHTDGHHSTVNSVKVPKRVAGFSTGGPVSAFNGMGVEGSWQAQLTQGPSSMSPLQLEVGWRA